MLKYSEWSRTIPRIIYQTFPDSDLLPIDPPKTGETIDEFSASARTQHCDLLFQHICEEAWAVDDAREYLALLDRAILDILSVRDAVRKMPAPRVRAPGEPHQGELTVRNGDPDRAVRDDGPSTDPPVPSCSWPTPQDSRLAGSNNPPFHTSSAGSRPARVMRRMLPPPALAVKRQTAG